MLTVAFIYIILDWRKKYLLPLLTRKVFEKPFKWGTSLLFGVWLQNQREEELCKMVRFKIHFMCVNNVSNCYWWHQGKNYILFIFCLRQSILLNPRFKKVLQNLKGWKNKKRVNSCEEYMDTSLNWVFKLAYCRGCIKQSLERLPRYFARIYITYLFYNRQFYFVIFILHFY